MGTSKASPDGLIGTPNRLLQFEVKVKSGYKQSGPSGWSYPGSCCIKQLAVFLLRELSVFAQNTAQYPKQGLKPDYLIWRRKVFC